MLRTTTRKPRASLRLMDRRFSIEMHSRRTRRRGGSARPVQSFSAMTCDVHVNDRTRSTHRGPSATHVPAGSERGEEGRDAVVLVAVGDVGGGGEDVRVG